MYLQQAIDFSQIVHQRENSPENEAILKSQSVRLSKNCQTLYEALLRGERLSGMVIMKKYGMTEYRKRIQELRKVLDIKETKLSNGSKEWYL